jgi:DNA polymerase
MTQDPTVAPARVARAMVQRLESLQRAGVTHLGKVPWGEVAAPTGADAVRDAPKADERTAALAAVARQVAACTRCPELARTRTQTVFGVGNPRARLVFCGEAPGEDEDRQGEPFVGRAGQLLNKIIAACTMRRGDVYILNILRCRPPGNRTPLPVEAANCREYLDRQLDIIQPEFICCLGAVAAQNLLETTASIGKLRGRFHDYKGAKVLCTYHPAYLLRNPAAKRPTWEDMQLLLAEMGIELPQR